jgi:hypothetical protein
MREIVLQHYFPLPLRMDAARVSPGSVAGIPGKRSMLLSLPARLKNFLRSPAREVTFRESIALLDCRGPLAMTAKRKFAMTRDTAGESSFFLQRILWSFLQAVF